MSLRKPFEMTKEGCPSIDFDIDFIPDGFELCELPGFTVPEIKRTSIPIIPPIAMPSLEGCVCIAPIYQSADSEITQDEGDLSLNIEIRHPPGIPEENIDCCDEPLEIYYKMNIPPPENVLPNGSNSGDILIWNGSKWEVLSRPGSGDYVLMCKNGTLSWVELETFVCPR